MFFWHVHVREKWSVRLGSENLVLLTLRICSAHCQQSPCRSNRQTGLSCFPALLVNHRLKEFKIPVTDKRTSAQISHSRSVWCQSSSFGRCLVHCRRKALHCMVTLLKHWTHKIGIWPYRPSASLPPCNLGREGGNTQHWWWEGVTSTGVTLWWRITSVGRTTTSMEGSTLAHGEDNICGVGETLSWGVRPISVGRVKTSMDGG